MEGLYAEMKNREKKYQQHPHWDMKTHRPPIRGIQHTGFYAGLFRGFFKPRVFLTAPVPDAGEELSIDPDHEEVGGDINVSEMPQLKRVEQICDADLQDWVDVEEDLEKDWVSVVAKRL